MLAAPALPRIAMRAGGASRAKGSGAAAAAPAAAVLAAPRVALGAMLTRSRRGAGVARAAAPASGAAAANGAGGADPSDAAASARYGLAPKSAGGARAQLTLPTLLTLARVAAVPALLAVYFMSVPWASSASCVIFLLAALTDWLDGYLARKMNLSSAFGAFLDPVADKLMVAAALVLLSTTPPPVMAAAPAWLIPAPAVAIIGREITMSAFREWASASGGDAHKAVAVNSLGKWKTATQMAAITALLGAGSAGSAAGGVAAAGVALLWVSAGLALASLGIYMSAGLPHMLK